MIEKEKILKSLLENPIISSKVDELKPTKKQLLDGLAILIYINEQTIVEDQKTIASFKMVNGELKKILVLSKVGKEKEFLNNIKTLHIQNIDFEIKKKLDSSNRRFEALKWFNDFNKGYVSKSLYLHGEMGIGKTFLFKRFARVLAKKGKSIGFINVNRLSSYVKSRFSIEGSTTDDILRLLSDIDHLFIDDIGSEKISSWFRDDFLFPILNNRMEKNAPTHFTSNYSIARLQVIQSRTDGKKYPEKDKAKRLISRIKSLTKELELKDINRRY